MSPALKLAMVLPVVSLLVLRVAAGSADADDGMLGHKLGHKTTAWEKSRANGRAIENVARDYKQFLGDNKTEREVVSAVLAMAKKAGHRDLFAKTRPTVKAGSRLYAVIDGKLAAVIVVGKKPISEGLHVVASHIDAVRIDLKQNPIYDDANMALLQTHYYGGIKKYQWLSIPLELRGVVVTKAGKVIKVAIGDDANEPVLVIPDVAIHVAWGVDSKEGEELPGESLDPIVSSKPRGKKADRFAAAAAAILKSVYKVEVADLASAELALVPAGRPRDVGLDRAMIGGYGQDDRSCSYAAVRALLETKAPQHTSMVVLTDKEEIGSHGTTGARSTFMRRVTAELLEGAGTRSTESAVDRALAASIVFSADVTGGVNPHYPDLYEKRNAPFLGSGIVWNQSGHHAELLAYVRRLFDGAGVTHQSARWTKSGGGGGGSVLEFFTQHGMRGLDISIPLLSMHAPFEVISKADLYQAYRGYKAFLGD